MDTDRYLQVPSTNLANSMSNVNVQTIFLANKCVRKAIGWTVRFLVLFSSLYDIMLSRIIVFFDASFANLPDHGSQGAYILFVCDKLGEYCTITWQSRQIHRVVNSTIAAEWLAAVEAAASAAHLKTTIKAIIHMDAGGRRSPAVACWVSDHWITISNPLGGKFCH